MSDVAAVRSGADQLRGLFVLLRPKDWIKNVFVVAPLLFTGKFLDLNASGAVLGAFLIFCIAASAGYIINDIRDVEADRRHPQKSLRRPLAQGIVSIPAAVALLVLLYALLIMAWMFVPNITWVAVAYIALNFAYSFALKHQPVVDIFLIAAGFVLRVYAGAVALSVPVSGWMFITTLCLALYLGAVKRRQELQQCGTDCRRVLTKYSVTLIERYAEMSATGALVFYSMFVMDERPELLITIPLVLFGLFRYWFVVEEHDAGESPTDVVLADWQLVATILLWAGACGWALWPNTMLPG